MLTPLTTSSSPTAIMTIYDKVFLYLFTSTRWLNKTSQESVGQQDTETILVVGLDCIIAKRYERMAQECLVKLESTESSVRDLVRTIQTSLTVLYAVRRDCSLHLEDVEKSLDAAVRGAKKTLQRVAEERRLCRENLTDRQQELRCANQPRIEVRSRQKEKSPYVAPTRGSPTH